MITIGIANQKGGVGKTTISFNLTHILAKKNGCLPSITTRKATYGGRRNGSAKS